MVKKKPVKVEKKSVKPEKDDGNVTACAVLSYLLVGIIWFFVDEKMKQSQFAKFHVKQALVLLIIDIVGIIALSIISMVLSPLWLVGAAISGILWFVFYIGMLVLWVLGIINSATGKEKEVPVVGHLAGKLTF